MLNTHHSNIELRHFELHLKSPQQIQPETVSYMWRDMIVWKDYARSGKCVCVCVWDSAVPRKINGHMYIVYWKITQKQRSLACASYPGLVFLGYNRRPWKKKWNEDEVHFMEFDAHNNINKSGPANADDISCSCPENAQLFHLVYYTVMHGIGNQETSS